MTPLGFVIVKRTFTVLACPLVMDGIAMGLLSPSKYCIANVFAANKLVVAEANRKRTKNSFFIVFKN